MALISLAKRLLLKRRSGVAEDQCDEILDHEERRYIAKCLSALIDTGHNCQLSARHLLDMAEFHQPGMLTPANLHLISHAVNGMPEEGAVIEIGSFAGLSLNHIIHMLRQAGRSNPVISVDEWQFEGGNQGAIPGSAVLFADYREHVIDTFRRNLMLFHADSLPHHIVSSSDAFFRLWAQKAAVVDFFGRSKTLGGPISFAYIDGDHSYEQSLRDFENVDRFLLPGGFIVFDDSADGSEWGSHRTACEAAARPDYELVDKAVNYCVAKRRPMINASI